jgi:ornithine carbamoyltransferase
MSAHQFATEGVEACPFMPVFGPPQVMFVRGQGTKLWDSEGREYLDFLSGLAVTSLGHSHPVVAAALADQASTLLHVSNLFANPVATAAAVDLVELFCEVTGVDGQIFFCNSGAEANEAALKLARKFGGRGRHTVVSALGSFHGRTLAALAATGQPTKHEPFQPMPEGFRHVPFNDVDALAAAIDPTVAAVLLEPVQGEGGVVPADIDYLVAVRRLCDERGVLLMLDEIQTGFGRTGRWFGFEHAGIVPDVVTMAKAMGNGVPVGAVWARRDVATVFQPCGGSRRRARRQADRRARGDRRTWRGAVVGGRTRAGSRRQGGAGAAARTWVGHQRRHGDGDPTRATAHRVLGRDRRGHRCLPRGAHMTQLLDIADLSLDDLQWALELAARPHLRTVLQGSGVALIFEKPSNRTRQSMEMAVVQLGGHPVYTRGEEVGFDVRETVEDITLVLAARVFDHHVVRRMAAVSPVPVVNMLSDRSHPLQALADVLTMQQVHGPLAGRVVSYLGDYNNVARSLGEACVLLGARLTVCGPSGFVPDGDELQRLRVLGTGDVVVVEDPIAAVAGAVAVHTDTWTSMGQEDEKADRVRLFAPYRVTAEVMAAAADDAGFYHCLPAYRGLEVAAEVIDGPSSHVIRQAHNRMHAARGALAFLLGVR